MKPYRFVTHSATVLNIANTKGWLVGARYTNLRDVRTFDRLGFLDIDWKNYNFTKHISAARLTKPFLTVAQDIMDIRRLPMILEQAYALAEHAENVIVVPKSLALRQIMNEVIPKQFIFGFSVPTIYGGTKISPKYFQRRVHLLGGRPDIQRKLASQMNVFSFDCNRFTLDARFGDFFNGDKFVKHPVGGYERCISDSINHINRIWRSYEAKTKTKTIAKT